MLLQKKEEAYIGRILILFTKHKSGELSLPCFAFYLNTGFSSLGDPVIFYQKTI